MMTSRVRMNVPAMDLIVDVHTNRGGVDEVRREVRAGNCGC